MTILPHAMNVATILCGLLVFAWAFYPKATVRVRVFWAVLGVLAVLRGVL